MQLELFFTKKDACSKYLDQPIYNKKKWFKVTQLDSLVGGHDSPCNVNSPSQKGRFESPGMDLFMEISQKKNSHLHFLCFPLKKKRAQQPSLPFTVKRRKTSSVEVYPSVLRRRSVDQGDGQWFHAFGITRQGQVPCILNRWTVGTVTGRLGEHGDFPYTWIFLLCVKLVPFHLKNLPIWAEILHIWKIQV